MPISYTSPNTLSNFKKTTLHDNLCYQGRRIIYDEKDTEGLYAICHTYLDCVENVQLAHWSNGTDASQQCIIGYTTQLQETSDVLRSTSVDLRAEFVGLTIGREASPEIKTFLPTETSNPTDYKLQLSVPPNSDLWVYQRRYTFRTVMTWVLNAWGNVWNVGSTSRAAPPLHIQRGETQLQIDTNDIVTTRKALTDEQEVDWRGEEYRNFDPESTWKWEDTTDRCKRVLRPLGIDGSQQHSSVCNCRGPGPTPTAQ